MKKATFVYNPNDVKPKYLHPWRQPGGKTFNSKSIAFEPGEGQVIFRCEFACPAGAQVRVRATALGIFELYLNGSRVGQDTPEGIVYDELKPTWTDYRSRVFEYEYDITSLVKDSNVLVAVVSPGWWSGRISFGFYGFKSCTFCGEIEFRYSRRARETCDGWKTTIGGAVRWADIWDGEHYDARCPDPTANPENRLTDALLYRGHLPDCQAGRRADTPPQRP